MTDYEKRIIELMVQKGMDKRTTMEAIAPLSTEQRQKIFLQLVEKEKELNRQKVMKMVIEILASTEAEDETYWTEE